MLRVSLILLGAAGVLAATPIAAQRLGTITFPTSAGPAAQDHFVRGVLFLHSFEYASAAEHFRAAQAAEPGFAMAYWGEAMTHTHPVWNEQDVSAARAVLDRLAASPAARLRKAPTKREQMYLDAVEVLYGEGTKPRRDTLYAGAMERLAAAHPDDDEAQAFYALALLGLNQGVRDVPTYMRAGAIAQELLRRNPDHPGAAHYTIHAFDDPVHAPLGLRAARLYSRIAPEAPHAQHMTTHIFVAMGMWDEVVSQNVAAAGHMHEEWQAGHYTAWLGYGYLQQGRVEQAREHLEVMRRNLGRAPRRGEKPSLLAMRAHFILNSERWTDPVVAWQIDPAGAGPVATAMDAFASGYAALKVGNRARAEQFLAHFAQRGGPPPSDAFSSNLAVPEILERQLRALLLLEDGKRNEALVLLREAAAQEDAIPLEFGPPDVVKPTHELLGEILLAFGESAAAQREFARALELAPGRARSLLGLGRAALAAGDREAARKALAELQRIWHSADAALPERAELDRLIARAM
jgi:tetratricopeptide (TPR) repeat protein